MIDHPQGIYRRGYHLPVPSQEMKQNKYQVMYNAVGAVMPLFSSIMPMGYAVPISHGPGIGGPPS